MQTYYFHLRDGTDVLLDPDGRLLPSLAAVAGAALFEARSIISADAKSGKISLGQSIDVENEAGKLVHTIAFTDAVQIKGTH